MIFTTHQEIDKCLCDIVAAKPFSSTDTLQSFMCPYINEGMLIMKSFDTSGHIESDILLYLDDLSVATDFASREKVSMQEIIDFFTNTNTNYMFENSQLRDGRKIIPFSKAVADRAGQCLEMAVLSQLVFQHNKQASLICGGKTNLNTWDAHSWNVRKKEGEYFIWDAGLGFYAPLSSLEVKEHGLILTPDLSRKIGNTDITVYQIGDA